jgi:hypothetical protein
MNTPSNPLVVSAIEGKQAFAHSGFSREQIEHIFADFDRRHVDAFEQWTLLAKMTEQEIHVRHQSGYAIGIFYPDPEKMPRILYH